MRTTFAHPFLARKWTSALDPRSHSPTTSPPSKAPGAVHTAPSHGPDDFATGVKYNLPLTCNVDAQGKLRNYEGLPFDGLFIFKANPIIIELLRERGALMGRHNLEHSYPHCWRCHNPLIFRATEQWFISMETPVLSPKEKTQTTFRQRALDEIERVTCKDPAWGEERISNMVATRPDWTISRQRIWGVPIAVFLCESCHEPLNNSAINKSIVQLFDREGADAWYKHSAADLLPKATKCPKCGGKEFRKEMDILDVWFESGSSWLAVLEQEPELQFPADLYTEGGDQHRGWFQSSLLNAVALRDTAIPTTMAITSGWTLDQQGRALSKSLGNGVDPVEVADRLGAEIIRLWVASVDFREDVVASENIMQRVSENYRKLRNTLRFLLSNLYDFSPPQHALHFTQLQPPDQYILARTAELDAAIRTAYDEFEFSIAPTRPSTSSSTPTSARALPRRRKRPPLHTRATIHPHVAAHRPRSGASPRASPASSRPSSASPPTRSGSICPHSKAANPVCTSPSSLTSPTSYRAASPGSKKTGHFFLQFVTR